MQNMTNTKQKEVWKTYPEYPFIEANQFGEIRTKDRFVEYKNGSKRLIKGRVLKQYLNKSGYMFVHFGLNGKLVNLSVHRVVAICFIPNPDKKPEVNHIDNDRTNNVVSNLEWCSRQYNLDYKKKFGTFGRPVIAVNLDTSEISWFETRSEAARQLDANQSKICKVIKGKVNKTKGYWFCDADLTAVEKTRKKFDNEIACKVKELMSEHL
ncbi:MAG: HNH endonuclease [Bacteriophage sp.]|nr:MAG: HNH endonuclease [Bacteriophage sp.]